LSNEKCFSLACVQHLFILGPMELLINLVLLVGILGGSALITQWFTGKMYNRCSRCRGLNAKRRSQCRLCGNPL